MPNTDNRAAQALTQFASTDAKGAAEQSARAFEAAGKRIEDALIKAAKTGELSFQDMAQSILQDLAKLAINQFFDGPIESLFGSLSGSKPGSAPTGQTPPVNIVMNISGAVDSGSLTRSQGQISAAIARAVSDGQRFF